MSKFQITGGNPLYGSVRLGGAKNASYKLMIASLLCQGESRLLNFSHIQDVQATREIIDSLGAKTANAGERTLFINASNLTSHHIDDQYGPKSRSSNMFIPVLLHRLGKASVPSPGGDKIGKRPLDRHFKGLEAMGAKIITQKGRISVEAEALHGTHYKFAKNSHTGTETLIMAAVLAKGETILENAALEPEVDDLINFLNQMGAIIRRRPGRLIKIEGVKKLKPTIYSIMPDRNEAVSYACAAIATKGDVIVENAQAQHLQAFLDKLDEIGAGYELGNYGIRFFYKGKLTATDLETQPHPGFMTDWQPLWTVLATQTQGESIIHETIFPNRFQHVEGLKKFGAKIIYFQPQLDQPNKVYNFELENDLPGTKHAIKIIGPTQLSATNFDVYDLRSGATLVFAALTAKGTTLLNNVELIDRGYESFDDRLRSMGAEIIRLK